MVRNNPIIVFMVLLTGCASGGGFSSNYIPQGTTIVQKESITIPTGDAHVLLQNGQISSAKKTDKYNPYCRFEVNKLSGTPAEVIKPGAYTISGVELNSVQVVGRTTFNYITKMLLNSPNNPNIRNMSCGAWQDNSTGDYISITQMQQALGKYFKIIKP